MTRIVTSTYRYKPPPWKRKPIKIEVPAIVTIDPRTLARRRSDDPSDAADAADPKKSRRSVGSEAAASREMSSPGRANKAQPSTPPERGRHSSVTTAGKAPAPANDDGPRKSAVIVVKSGRRPDLSGAAAEVSHRREPAMAGQLTRLERADQANPSTTSPARKSAIVTVRDRKTVPRQREQQQMAKALASDGPTMAEI